MPKENTPGQKPASRTPKAAHATSSIPQPIQSTPQPEAPIKKSSGKGNKSHVGGTAVPNAKSMQPKPATATNNASQQQAESYNRDMRRRMQHLGTGPYNDNQKVQSAKKQRQKRIERRQQRLDEQRERLRKSMPGGKITLGRRNTYFIIAVAVLVVAVIAVFAVLRTMHIL